LRNWPLGILLKAKYMKYMTKEYSSIMLMFMKDDCGKKPVRGQGALNSSLYLLSPVPPPFRSGDPTFDALLQINFNHLFLWGSCLFVYSTSKPLISCLP